MVERVKVGELLEIVELCPGLYTAACPWCTVYTATLCRGGGGLLSGMVELIEGVRLTSRYSKIMLRLL